MLKIDYEVFTEYKSSKWSITVVSSPFEKYRDLSHHLERPRLVPLLLLCGFATKESRERLNQLPKTPQLTEHSQLLYLKATTDFIPSVAVSLQVTEFLLV